MAGNRPMNLYGKPMGMSRMELVTTPFVPHLTNSKYPKKHESD